jgi:heme/copper-type cytochrome/quinol oxidase subunit 4
MPKFIKKIIKAENNYKKELIRTHLIVTLLSIGIITLLSLGIVQPVTFDPTLSIICIVLLGIVTLLSLLMVFGLVFKKQKN